MLILITCHELAVRAGSQLYTRDLAVALRREGHRVVVFAPTLGEVAEEIRQHGVATISSLDQLGATPDLIHGQHHLQAMAAMTRFPDVPAIFVCHGWLPWQEAPPRFPSIRRYVAVDSLRRDRLIFEHGIDAGMIEVIENFVDVERFRHRTDPLPPRPRRALLFSNQAGENDLSETIRAVCASRDLDLEIVGYHSGRTVGQPELLLPEFDLVLARGRSALEAMATGAAVILCDIEGDGPMVTPENFEGLRSLNFGVGALQHPLDRDRLARAVDSYDPGQAERVSELVRQRCTLPQAVEKLLRIYHDVLLERPAGSTSPEISTSRYLEWLGPFLERQIDSELNTATREAFEARTRVEQEGAELRRLLEQTITARHQEASAQRHDLELAHSERTEVAGKLKTLENELLWTRRELYEAQRQVESATDALGVLQQSPFSRIRNALLQVGPLVKIYRRIRGR